MAKLQTMLVVDDSRLQRVILNGIFKDSFRIVEASSGEECLEILAREGEKIDIILLDLVMPGMDGFEVLTRKRESPVFGKIPVIVLTMSEEEKDRARAFSLGAVEFLSKPVDPEAARLCVRRVLQTAAGASLPWE